LVYQQYVKSALIEANPFSVFTYPEYISRNSAVILGKLGDKSVCSVSAVLDTKHRLPLDACFHEELDSLRRENKKLIEIGLLANQSKTATPFYIFELLSSIARFGVYSNFHDYVIGVHPRRANFFKHFFGFNQVGEKKVYHTLHDADVVLLHADGQKFETLAQKASHAIYFEETDLKFEERFRFIRMASLLPYKAVIYFVSFFLKLRQQFFPLKNKGEHHFSGPQISERNNDLKMTEEASVLYFQSVIPTDVNNGLHSEKDKNEIPLRNLQTEFNLTEMELEAMMDEGHFNDQY
jgi:hypothetical protein